MATKPAAWQEQGPVNSLDEWVNESWAQGEEGAIINHSFPLQDKKAPKAEPEEDIDVLEPGAQDESLAENQTLSSTTDATELKNQESTRISSCTPGETQEMVTELEQVAGISEALQTQEESEESVDLCENTFSPPPPFSGSSTEECCDREGFSSPEGGMPEWIIDAEIISDPKEGLTSPDSQSSQEWPQAPPQADSCDGEVDSTFVEMTGDNMTKDITQLKFLTSYHENSEPENNVSGAVPASVSATPHSPSDRNNSDDVYTACSPPFADESGEEEEVSTDIVSCQQQCSTQDIRGNSCQPSYSAKIIFSSETSTPPAVSSVQQQDELLSQSTCELAPRGANQEAAQQVLSQSSPPLTPVAMELSNQGGAPSESSGCVVPWRERHSRAGERTEEKSKRTGGEGGQKESGLKRNKVARERHNGGMLENSKIAPTQKIKAEKKMSSEHTKMETDSCDDSQSDSGVSADFSPCSTLEGNTTISTGTPAVLHKETPIEREIRRAIEREHSLRRSRGLPNLPTSPEYVEIPLRKNVLCQSVTAKSERCQGKDRQFAGKKMQHEIHEEVRREQDLVKLGKVPGFYDKGTVRQLKERKQLFEAFQKPNESTLTVSSTNMSMSLSSVSDISTRKKQDDTSSTIGGSYVQTSHTQSPNTVRGGSCTSLTSQGPGFSEAKGSEVIILENDLSVPTQKLHKAKPEAKPVTVVDSGRTNGGHDGINWREQEKEEEEVEVTPKENPFFKLRSSANLIKVEQDIREAQEREKELHKQRMSLYGGMLDAKGGGRGRGGRPANIDGKSLVSYSVNGLDVPDLSSREVTEPKVSQSVAKLAVWPPAKADEKQMKRPEVTHSPRAPRQKTPLVQRWESGLVNGHNEEDD